jgi:hypothetical protein
MVTLALVIQRELISSNVCAPAPSSILGERDLFEPVELFLPLQGPPKESPYMPRDAPYSSPYMPAGLLKTCQAQNVLVNAFE